MPGVDYVIYGCFSARTTSGVSLSRSLSLAKNVVAVITQDRVIDDNLKREIKKPNFGYFVSTNLSFSKC